MGWTEEDRLMLGPPTRATPTGVAPQYALGLDFGTESVRALIVDVRDGRTAGQAVVAYAHGVIDRALPGSAVALPSDYALQHPGDWWDGAAAACRAALAAAGTGVAERVVGIGVDFTSCTMLPTTGAGEPLCFDPAFARDPQAWPKLWKHHGAKAEADDINRVARERNEPWLGRYGGSVSLEWFFPKVLEALRASPRVFAAADVWVEAGDWYVWRLTGRLVRSTCQAGYKACWNREAGYPSRAFFQAVEPALADVVGKMPGEPVAPGERAGVLTAEAAAALGLREGTPVSAATIDAHAGVPGAGVAEAGTMVLVLGTSACHMVNAEAERLVPGVAGVVEDGILPGYFGYETGQASFGDAYAWVARTTGLSHAELTKGAVELPPGAGGVSAVDWLNGCRTPLMDPRLSGAFFGITLATRPAQLYRAMLEATAFGVRAIADALRGAGVPVRRFVASGGLPERSPLLMQICADVLGAEIQLAASEQSVALGAAILGALAAGAGVTGHASAAEAVRAMARVREDVVYRPEAGAVAAYEKLYGFYREVTEAGGVVARVMRGLR